MRTRLGWVCLVHGHACLLGSGPTACVLLPVGALVLPMLLTLAGASWLAHRVHVQRRLLVTDELTGVWNYRWLIAGVHREIQRAARYRRPLAVLMLDLDRFKTVNDTYGHEGGNTVLRETAQRLAREIRGVDILARYGGEEFALVLPETGLDAACQVAARLCEVVGGEHFGRQVLHPPARVTVSIGVAVFPDHATTAADLMAAADLAMYDAKRSGRARWSLATAGRLDSPIPIEN